MNAVDNRQRIVACADLLIAERGYAGMALGELAERTGLLKGNLSYYFKTKAELLAAVTQARRTAMFEQLNGDSTPHEPALSAARGRIERFLDYIESQDNALARWGCPIGTLCGELGKEEGALMPQAAAVLNEIEDWLAVQFRVLTGTKTARTHAQQLLAMMQGAAVVAHARHDPAVVRRLVAASRSWLTGLVGAL